MLSPGEWWKRVPRGMKENLLFRRFVLRRTSDRRALIEACRRDIIFFINVFVYQYNGKKRGQEVGPFISWDFQVEAVKAILSCIDTGQDLIIEKSRDMGASWLCLIIVLWLWLFHPWKTILVISKSAEAVEDENPESLFWKLDFILRYLPNWLKQGYDEKTHRRKMCFSHPNGSTIYGQASTGRAGVGGKCTLMFIDELSQIKEGYEVLHRTSDTTDCRVFNGTHLGLDTVFYELTDPNSVAGSFMKKLQMHWTQHPDKSKGLYRLGPRGVEIVDKQYAFPDGFRYVLDGSPVGGPFPGLRSPWYDEQCKRKGSSFAVAMDLDINPSGSVSQVFDPFLIRALVAECVAPYWQGNISVDTDTGRLRSLTQAKGGNLKLWCLLDDRDEPPRSRYTAGADTAAGTGATNSCLTIFDASLGEKVLEFASAHVEPKEFAAITTALCWLFAGWDGEPAFLAWEMQGPGKTMGMKVVSLGFRNIYYRANEFKSFSGNNPDDTPGWYPSDDGKRFMIDEYQAALKNREFVNRSEEALLETLKFERSRNGKKYVHPGENTNDPSGAGVNHGDRVIADALAWKMAKGKGAIIKKEKDEEVPYGSFLWRRMYRNARRNTEDAWA